MSKFLRVTLIFALQFMFNSISYADAENDLKLKSKLIGQWQELRDLGCEGHQQTITLHANGTFKVNGIIRACDKETAFIWQGKWKVKDSRFWYKTTSSTPKDVYPLGEEFSDEIVSVSLTEWIMNEESTGNQSHAFRVK